MSAGLAMLQHLNENPLVYKQIEDTTIKMVAGVQQNIEDLGLPYTINHVGSMFSIFFTNQKVTDFETAKSCDTALFGKYFQAMLQRGVYLAPSQFETLFVCNALSDEDIAHFIKANDEALKEITQ
jgi:glutamate-1-semialdehyde 2,1-aminomutase